VSNVLTPPPAMARASLSGAAGGTAESARWRTVDIIVVAIIAVAFGVVFWAWDAYVWVWLGPLGNPWEYIVSGMWLMPAVVAPLIVRKPGAGLFAEIVAAVVSVVLGSQWGLDTLLSGFVQGAGAELVFGFLMYRSFGPIVAFVAGAGAGVGEALHDINVWFPTAAPDLQFGIAALEILSGALIAGLLGWLLVRSLRRTGALQAFPSGS
jgi:energy-coupling factor transport system permease protein